MEKRYDPIAVLLHWTMALLIIGMIVVGLVMGDVQPMSLRFTLINLHKALGITILALSVFRLVWRFLNPPPALPAGMPAWERLAAHFSHWALYAFIILMPLSGWLMTSASAKYPIVFFGLGEAPFIPMPADAALTKSIGSISGGVHDYLWIGGAALIAVHLGAALKHHFIDRDTVLTRMLPRFLTR